MGLQQSRVIAARILDAAIGVMDEASWCGTARRQRHAQRRGGEACLQMGLQCPADDAPAERIEHDGKISELLLQPDVVMSATQSWSRPVGTMPRARFATTRQSWRESVVKGVSIR
jgi:hypothetical protein